MAATTPPTARPCPICGKPAVRAFKPFCSSRCSDLDLHRWLSDAYAIPIVETDDAAEPDNGVPDAEKN